MSSLSAGFNYVPELIVKRCVQFITIPLVHIVHLSFPSNYFPDILQIAEIQPLVKKGDEQYTKNYRPIWGPQCYKSEVWWFDSRWCHWNFSLTKSFRSHNVPGFDAASKRNEYQENFLGVNAASAKG